MKILARARAAGSDQAPRNGAQDSTENHLDKGAATITRAGLRKPLPELLAPETYLFKLHALDSEPHHTQETSFSET